MKTTIKLTTLVVIALLILMGCKTNKSSSYLKVDMEAKNSELKINLGAPINTASKDELSKKWYNNGKYFLVQSKENQFKDNAPFFEYLDGGKRERLWFSSARADSLYKSADPTNFYQQLYYCEREVGDGKCPNEAWNEPVRFALKNNKPQLREYIDGFNKATKGAVAIAGNTMIFSCDQWDEKENWNSIRCQLRNLWEIDLSTLPYAYPTQIMSISGINTWESQPTLSLNGKHLFFVSNRYVYKNDLSYTTDSTGNDLNIFYSFRKNDEWSKPVLVKELYSGKNEITPHISVKGNILYYSSDKSGDYEIYQVDLSLDDKNGGYSLKMETLKPFDQELISFCDKENKSFFINGSFNQKYPCYYYNSVNKKYPQAFFWSSDNPQGMGSYDIYGCSMPFNVLLNITLADLNPQGGNQHVANPVIELSGAKQQVENKESVQFSLYSGLAYQVKGGSTASSDNGTYSCDVDPSYIFVGYCKPNRINPLDKKFHSTVINGPEVESELTRLDGKIQIMGLVNDTTVYDTVYVTKAWTKKLPCPGKLNITPTYRSVAYFQTGFWEVNTTDNLKRDLAKLHEGFEVTPNDDFTKPSGKIIRNRSDYKAVGFDEPMFPIKTNDHYTYSIANAPWIELHPNNQYWGDRPGYESKLDLRMKGRKERIDQYFDYAKKVDTNLKNLTDTIKNKYIHLLDLHREMRPQLLIEIIAVSDPREVSRSWYIGDTVSYRGSTYNEIARKFETEKVKIVPPRIDEKNKIISNIKSCSIDLNSDGDNGSLLGISKEETPLNTNLSRLRAWYGYREVLKRLTDSEVFKRFLNEGKVALPDNDIPYDKADIIIITYGKRTDGDIKNPEHPYPTANNPSGNGFYDYDELRHMEIQTRLLIGKDKGKVDNYCCDPIEIAK
jgi:hypothetical protein